MGVRLCTPITLDELRLRVQIGKIRVRLAHGLVWVRAAFAFDGKPVAFRLLERRENSAEVDDALTKIGLCRGVTRARRRLLAVPVLHMESHNSLRHSLDVRERIEAAV